MSPLPKNTKATVIPCLRYRDAAAALEWLCRAFGFEKQLVVPNKDGTIAHAQLSFGNGMIMLGSFSDDRRAVIRVRRRGSCARGAAHCAFAARRVP